MKQCCSQNCTHFSATVVTGPPEAEPEAVTQEAHAMFTRWITIIALLTVVVVATGCAATEDGADEEFMSPPPIATALVITGSQAFPTSAPSLSAYASEDAPYQVVSGAAEFAELLRHSYQAREGSLSEVETQAHRLRGLLPDDTDVAELADLASIAARIQQADAGR